MASIKIQNGHKNLLFAAAVANSTGAEFREDGQWIIIEDSPELTIPHYDFIQAFDPDGRRDAGQLESAWRSLILNKSGYLRVFDDSEIIVNDEQPKDRRPQFLLRFPSVEAKAQAEGWADRAGFGTLTDYINAAIEAFGQYWSSLAQDDSE